MIMSFLHKSRIVLAASVGIALTFAVVGGIMISMKVDPRELSLADRTDPTRTLVYISTTERQTFFSALERFATLMNGIGPTEADIAIADRYEFALLRSGSGTVDWTMYGRNEKEGSHVTLVSRNDPSLFLSVASRKSSLAYAPLFAYIPKPAGSFVWFRPDSLALPRSNSGDIGRALLTPYKEGMLVLDGAGRGRLMLKAKTSAVQGSITDVSKGELPLFGISLSDPSHLFSSAVAALAEENPSLLEGMTGIAQVQLEKMTGSTDITVLGKDLLSGPLSMVMRRGEERTMMVITGTASHTKTMEMWMSKITSVMTEGSVRRQEFFKNEYTKIDVTADESSGLSDIGDYKGWTMKRLGAASDHPFTIAVSGRTFMVGNDESLVKAHIDGSTTTYPGLASGSADIAWLSTELERRLPFLQPIRPTLEALLGSSPSRLAWHARPIPGGISLEWSLANANPDQKGTVPQKNARP